MPAAVFEFRRKVRTGVSCLMCFLLPLRDFQIQTMLQKLHSATFNHLFCHILNQFWGCPYEITVVLKTKSDQSRNENKILKKLFGEFSTLLLYLCEFLFKQKNSLHKSSLDLHAYTIFSTGRLNQQRILSIIIFGYILHKTWFKEANNWYKLCICLCSFGPQHVIETPFKLVV